MAGAIAARFRRRVLYVVPNETLLNQATRDFAAMFPALAVGHYYGKTKRIADVTIMIVNSAVSPASYTYEISDAEAEWWRARAAPKAARIAVEGGTSVRSRRRTVVRDEPPVEFFRQFYFAVADEAHEYASESERRLFERAQAPCVLAMSATPDERADGFDDIVDWQYGPRVRCTELAGYRASDVRFTGTYTRVEDEAPPEYARAMESWHDTLMEMARDPYRTQLIAQVVRPLAADPERYVYASPSAAGTPCSYAKRCRERHRGRSAGDGRRNHRRWLHG